MHIENTKTVIVGAPIMQTDVINKNKRVYPSSVEIESKLRTLSTITDIKR